MLVGETFLERYRIDRILGTGGMGHVFAATDNRTQQQVALKILAPERTDDATAVARMFREAEAATQLVGRYTGRILDVATANGAPVLVMEHLEGEDLARHLARVGMVSEPAAIAMILDACEGLAEAHARGLVHRDIKPSNLFLTRDLDGSELVKVIDFGVVKNQLADAATLTTTMSMVGSVSYMAPEQLRKLAVDERADVWALGVVLYELVSGRRPFPAETITDASIRIAVEAPEALPGTVSAPLAQTILQCLEKDPAQRIASVGELAQALAPGSERAARIVKTLGHVSRVAPPRLSAARTWSVRARDFLAAHWLLAGVTVVLWSLLLLLGSFAVDDRLNEFTIGGKRTGYVSSFNWTLVHTLFSPVSVAILGLLWRATSRSVATFGDAAVTLWNRKTRNILVLGLVMSAAFGIGYTIVEWSYVTTGRCDRGTFLGWPNQLCTVAGGSATSLAFMVVAASAQALVLCTGWMVLSTVLWMSEMFFGANARRLDDREIEVVGKLFGIATWAWAALFAGLYTARLWSVHLRTPGAGVLETVLDGSLFAIDAHTQTDWGSMIAGGIMLIAAAVPFVILRLRRTTVSPSLVTLQRTVATLGIVGFISMVFPRVGFFALPALALGALAIGSVRRTLFAAWPR